MLAWLQQDVARVQPERLERQQERVHLAQVQALRVPVEAARALALAR